MVPLRFLPAAAAALALLGAASFTSCSSAPKVPPQVLTVRNEAGRLNQMGAKSLREGQIEAARDFYAEAYRLFTAADDVEGRIRALDGLGRVTPEGVTLWDQAMRIAGESGREDLMALASLLKAEADLRSEEEPALRGALETSRRAASALSARPSDRTRALRVYGSAAKSLGLHQDALKALDEAASIDKKNRAYIEYASDRYLSASVHSKQGNYAAAVSALQDALDYDRRAENSGGIAGDYLALGIVAEKMGDREGAKLYYRRSMEVYEAARLKAKAAEAAARLQALP